MAFDEPSGNLQSCRGWIALLPEGGKAPPEADDNSVLVPEIVFMKLVLGKKFWIIKDIMNPFSGPPCSVP